MLQPQEYADHVDVKYAAEAVEGISGDRRDVALDAGVVVEDVDGAEFVDRRADVGGNLVLVCDVGGNRERLRRGRQVPDRRLQVFTLAVDGDDFRTALGKQAHGGTADHASGPGDDGDLAVEANTIGHLFPLSLLEPGSLLSGAKMARISDMGGLFHPEPGVTRPLPGPKEGSGPFPAVFGVLTGRPASGGWSCASVE
jgi:hypothetical protein